VARQVSLAQFNVLMGEFNDAIGVVSRHRDNVHDTLTGIEQHLNAVAGLWNSPAALTFEPLRAEFRRSADDLDDVLKGIVHRMRITYANYVDAERKAQKNLTPDPQGSHTAGQNGGKDGSLQPSKREGVPVRPLGQDGAVPKPGEREALTQPSERVGVPLRPRGQEAAPLKPHTPEIHPSGS
jgi:uncharacterized protein YukE